MRGPGEPMIVVPETAGVHRGGRGPAGACVVLYHAVSAILSFFVIGLVSPPPALSSNARRASAVRAVCSRQRPSGWLQAAAGNRCYSHRPHARRLGAGELAVCKAGGRASPSVGSHFHRHGAGRCGSRDPPRTHCMRLPSPTLLLLRGRRRWCLQQQARRMPHPMQSSPSAC